METSLILFFLLLNPIVNPPNSPYLVYALKFSYAITFSLKREKDSTFYCHILSILKDSPTSSEYVIGFLLALRPNSLTLKGWYNLDITSLRSLMFHYFPHSNTVSNSLIHSSYNILLSICVCS